ncbi:4-hydroxybenzoate polyprenyltransferase [Neorhizobium huautlense]|uniref:4-hydroxybenzoate octaprenyltransferase n=1 Tax=Neorhizobium huautlense TaxID=67774 RepID=A0ABT9PV71_9HYPH|nr:4-hydroxybenzoate octaprenyltransferase [Neorhizobium huautlense]MDP9838366.1 4-hydroxybenzoate polyprenyltransferase [Neorhizobium huautlense]
MTNAPDDTGRVADAPSDNWVYNVLPRAAWPYAQLARWDRPIGWQLLMWPCFWSVGLAANRDVADGHFSLGWVLFYLFLFFVGSVAMRGAGCTYNDLVDHDIDMEVARTRSRPLPSGRVSRTEAKLFLGAQALVGLWVLLQFNLFSIGLGILSLAVVAIYPFAKRFTDWPQFFLGLAFSWGALMGWSALFSEVSWASFFLYVAAVLWTIGYDTIYAHQDKEDDALVGVRSTARLFAENTKAWLIGLYGLALLFLIFSFAAAGVGVLGYLGLGVAAIMFAWQILILEIDNPDHCLRLFKSNGRVGAVIFVALMASLASLA